MKERFEELSKRMLELWEQRPEIPVKTPPWLLRWVAYPAFFLYCFFLFCYLTFPYERVRDYLVHRIEFEEAPGGGLRPTGWDLDIVELSPSFFTGVEVEGVRLRKAPADEDDDPIDVAITSAYASTSFFSLLFGDLDLDFGAEIAQGSVDGEIELAGVSLFGIDREALGLRSIEMELESLNLRRLGPAGRLYGLPLRGILSGEIDLDLPEDPRESNGTISLRAENVRVGNGRAKMELPGMSDGLTLDPLDVGNIELEVTVEDGEGAVTQLTSTGPHLELTGAGSVHFANPVQLTRMDLLLRLEISDEYKSSSARTEAMFSLVEVNPRVRPARTSDGALQFRVRGSVASELRATPAGREELPGAG